MPHFLKTLFLIILTTAGLATAKETPACPWLPLWEGKAPGPDPATQEDKQLDNGEHITRIALPSCQIWLPRENSVPRPALCVFPGGGYGILAIKKEGERIAQWAAENGMVGIVVKYRVSDTREDGLEFPVPLIDARRAVRLARHNAGKWNIDPSKVGVIGFSAGGHLAAVTATTWDRAFPEERDDDIDKISSRPDFALLIYPVISLDQPYGHGGTKSALLRNDHDGKYLELCTPYKQVTEKTPPLFLVHAANDPVSCLNSIDMARAAKERKIPVELHLYAEGGHGFGNQQRGLPIDSWPKRAEEWLHAMKILSPAP